MAQSEKLLMKKLEHIRSICLDNELKVKEPNNKNNPNIVEENIIQDIKEARNLLKQREDKTSVADKAKINHSIRLKIKSLKDNLQILEKSLEKSKKNQLLETDEITNKDNVIDNLKRRVAFIEQQENPARFVDLTDVDIENNADKVLVGSIPEYNDDDFMELKKTDEEIDKDLDDILRNLQLAKEIAIQQNNELADQEIIIEELEGKTEKVSKKLKDANVRIDKLLRKKSGTVCCSILLLMIVIAIVFLIISFVR